MTVSVRGVWLRILRPGLGKVKRKTTRVASRLNAAGQPSAELEKPRGAPLGMFWFWVGAVLHRLHRFDQAAQAYSRAIRYDKRFPEWHYQLGNVERYRGDWAAATRAYECSLELNPGLHKSHFWLGVCLNQQSSAHESEVAGSSRRGERRRRHAEVADRALLHAAVACEPEARYSFWLGVSHHYRGRLPEALDAYERAIAHEPDHALWHRQLGFLRQQLGDWKEAVAQFEEAMTLSEIESDPSSDHSGQILTTEESNVSARLPSHDSLRELSEAYASAPMSDSKIAPLMETRSGTTRLENWAAAAVLYRAAVDRSTATARHQYWLGVSLQRLGDWPAAAEAIEGAISLEDGISAWYDRLGTVQGTAGEWEAVRQACETALAFEPTGQRYHRLAVAYQRLGRWRESSEAYARAVEIEGEVVFSRVHRLSSVRAEMEDWAGAAALYRSALEDNDDPRYHFWLGQTLAKLGDWCGAVAEYETAIMMRGKNADWHFRLGYAHEHAGSPTPEAHPRLGLVSLGVRNLPAAIASYQRATVHAPEEPRYWMRLGHVQERVGELEAALDSFRHATELDPNDGQAWHRYGRAVAAIANRRGAYLVDEHDQLEKIWGRALELVPGLSGSRQQLVRASVKVARWEVASKAAWYPPPPSGSREIFDALRTYVENPETVDRRERMTAALDSPLEDLRNVPLEWWFVLHWRLLTEGHFTLGFKAKTIMAEEIVAGERPHPDENLSLHLEIGSALIFLGRDEDALRHLATEQYEELSDIAELALRKQAADAELLRGHVDPYASLLALNDSVNTHEAEVTFRQLIEGKRVAIVGPTASLIDHGAEIDDFDVIVRTKFVSKTMEGFEATVGSRTELSYYALGSARFLEAEIVEALQSGDLKMVIFRTATYNPNTPYLEQPGDVRYVPSEFSASFRSAQFAIQRITYDLLRYRPAQIKVFNINFFLEEDAYRPGYLADYVDKFSDLGLQQILGAFGHDFLSDFVFTQRLHELGLIDVDEHIETLLRLTPEMYLRGLDTR